MLNLGNKNKSNHRFLKRLPLVSGLVGNATGEDYLEAFKEWSLVSLLALSPMIFSVITDIVSIGSEVSVSWDLVGKAFVKNFQQGEVFIYAITSLAPVIFTLYKYTKERFPFKNSLSFQVTALIIGGSASLLFGLLRSGVIKNTTILNYVHCVSIMLYLISLVITYFSFVYSNILSDKKIEEKAKQLMNSDKDEKKLSDELEGYKPE